MPDLSVAFKRGDRIICDGVPGIVLRVTTWRGEPAVRAVWDDGEDPAPYTYAKHCAPLDKWPNCRWCGARLEFITEMWSCPTHGLLRRIDERQESYDPDFN